MPGQVRARDVARPNNDGGWCPDYNFCAYEKADMWGVEIQMSKCNKRYDIPWSKHDGSWVNNQSDWVRAFMYGNRGNLIYETPGAPYRANNADWYPVWSVQPC